MRNQQILDAYPVAFDNYLLLHISTDFAMILLFSRGGQSVAR
jgi:hypothetical protein